MGRLQLDTSAVYQICVQGILDQDCRDYLPTMKIINEYDENANPVTTFTSSMIDQAGLLGMLTTLYNYYQLPLLSVKCVSINDN